MTACLTFLISDILGKEKTVRSISITEVQAERAIRSIVEVDTVKSLRSHWHDADTKHQGPEKTNVDYALSNALDKKFSIADNQKAWLDPNYGPSFFNSYEFICI